MKNVLQLLLTLGFLYALGIEGFRYRHKEWAEAQNSHTHTAGVANFDPTFYWIGFALLMIALAYYIGKHKGKMAERQKIKKASKK